jgi:hypothetical protein
MVTRQRVPPCSAVRALLTWKELVRVGSWLRGNSETEFANRKFVPTSINLKNESAGDGRGDKTIEKTILRTFRARTFSRSQGQSRPCWDVRFWRILLQKSKVASVRIFGETLKREVIDDSNDLSRITEVSYQLDDCSRAVARITGKRSILNSSFPRRSL